MTIDKKELTVKAKILKISNEIRIDKEGKNPFQNFDYFRPDDIARALNPLLEKYELVIFFNMPFDSVSNMYQCTLTIESISSDDKIVYRYDTPLTKVQGSSEAQGAGATMTYARRYLLQNAFNIAENGNDLDNKSFSTQKPATAPIRAIKSDEKGEPCPECKTPMVIKTGKKKNGRTWRGQQCPNKECKHYKEYIFLPDEEVINKANHQDSIDEQAHQQYGEFGEPI